MVRCLHGDSRGFGGVRGPKEVRHEPRQKILWEPGSHRGEILPRDAPRVTKRALLHRVTAGMHASCRRVPTECIWKNH